ncbi:MAG: hypothetical protein ACP5F1_06535 [Thermoplasmata archaeon]|nr:hypothetical protein [Thermoplasmata archaeon]
MLRDTDKITEMIKNYSLRTELLIINPIYYEKKLNIEKLDEVERIAVRLSKDISKSIIHKKILF